MADSQPLDSNLQLYAERSVLEMSPIKRDSDDMKDKAQALEITDAASLRTGLDLRKLVVKHINTTADLRKQYTRPLDQVTKQLIAGESAVLTTAEEAKTIIGNKIMEYEAEQERIAGVERERIAGIIATFTTAEAVSTKKITLIDGRGAELKKSYGELPVADQQDVSIKLAFTQAVNRLLEAREILSRAYVDDEEQTKAQHQRQADELTAQREADTASKATVASSPKTGVKMVTKFTIIRADQVPHQYCIPSDPLIRQAIAVGVTEIPGVNIYKERSF